MPTTELRLTANTAASRYPSIAWTVAEFAIVWRDDTTGNDDLYFTRVDAQGTKLGGDVPIVTDPSSSTTQELVWTGAELGLVWTDTRDGNSEIYFTRLSATGTRLAGDLRITNDPAGSTLPRIAWTGSRYVIAWHDSRGSSLGDIYATLLDAAGTKLTGDLQITGYSTLTQPTSITATPTGVAIAFYYDDDAYVALLDACGNRRGGDILVTTGPGGSFTPSIAWAGSELAVAYHNDRAGTADVFFQRLTPEGALIGTETQVTNVAGDSYVPQLVWTNPGFAIAWYDERDGNREIYAARLDAQGTVIAPDNRLTMSNGISDGVTMSWAGTGAGLAWEDDRTGGQYDIYFRIVNP